MYQSLVQPPKRIVGKQLSTSGRESSLYSATNDNYWLVRTTKFNLNLSWLEDSAGQLDGKKIPSVPVILFHKDIQQGHLFIRSWAVRRRAAPSKDETNADNKVVIDSQCLAASSFKFFGLSFPAARITSGNVVIPYQFHENHFTFTDKMARMCDNFRQRHVDRRWRFQNEFAQWQALWFLPQTIRL